MLKLCWPKVPRVFKSPSSIQKESVPVRERVGLNFPVYELPDLVWLWLVIKKCLTVYDIAILVGDRVDLKRQAAEQGGDHRLYLGESFKVTYSTHVENITDLPDCPFFSFSLSLLRNAYRYPS